MKKFFLFSANYLPNLGGVERYTYNLAVQLIEKGNKVTVITSNTDRLVNYEVDNGITIIRLPCFNLLNGRFPVLKVNKEFIILLKILMANLPDLIIINTRFYVHSFFAAIFARKNKIKSFVVEHGTNHFTINKPFLDFIGRIYEHLFTLVLKRLNTDYYGVSDECNKWLQHFNIAPKGVLHNAIDINHINDLLKENSKDYKKVYNLSPESVIITYTGRLVKEKGVIKLLHAIKRVLSENNKVHLFIAGDGDLLDEIKKSESKNITVLGRISFEEIISLLKITHIFCLPTDYPEGFPTSVLEAAACMCYIITTKAGGSKELILDENYGCILKENTINEIYEEVLHAIKNPNKRVLAINESYNYLINNFTWDIIGEKVIQIQ